MLAPYLRRYRFFIYPVLLILSVIYAFCSYKKPVQASNETFYTQNTPNSTTTLLSKHDTQAEVVQVSPESYTFRIRHYNNFERANELGEEKLTTITLPSTSFDPSDPPLLGHIYQLYWLQLFTITPKTSFTERRVILIKPLL